MSTIDQAQIRESRPAKDYRRPEPRRQHYSGE